MRPIAERLLLREATSAELWVFDGAGDIAIGIDEFHRTCYANRSALGIDKSFHILTHGYGLIEIVAKSLRTRWVAKLRHCL
jgi:hypothetical protein